MENNTTLILILIILAGHFVVGIGYLLYQVAGPRSQEKQKREE